MTSKACSVSSTAARCHAVCNSLWQITRREFLGFFSSPTAYLFLGVFLATLLFVFFWVETFFSRNIADLRPLFEWMPVLLIFLVAALTMRQWAEERRSGTLELLLTSSVPTPCWVLGKFLAALGLVALALALTLPLSFSVAALGPLDWGPVVGAYLASLLLAAAYVSIGLFMSARTDNQLVSLIGTLLLCGLLYLLGADALDDLFDYHTAEWLRRLGIGSRFESIARGVIDPADLYYYLSICLAFLTLGSYSVERLRWVGIRANPRQRRWRVWSAALVLALLGANALFPFLGQWRVDLTADRIYTLSDVTRGYLQELDEPLLIRGYFSARTHPLLAPLVPQLRDLLQEYAVAGQGKVRVEFIDPQLDPEAEREAGEKYGVKPVTFQVNDKYQSSVVNSYFDIVLQYGDQYERLGFKQLIEAKLRDYDRLDIRLRNPEYDITRAIKRVMAARRSAAAPFAGLERPIIFHGFISADETLPAPLRKLRRELTQLLTEYQAQANGQLLIDIRDPAAAGGELAQQIRQVYGYRPFTTSPADPRSFYFYMLLESAGRQVPVPLPAKLDAAHLRQALDSAFKRVRPGLLRTLALYAPKAVSPLGIPREAYKQLRAYLAQNSALIDTDLKNGEVPTEADLLLVVDPKGLGDRQVFAIDQYLMRGGSVIIALSPFAVDAAAQVINITRQPTGLEPWLDALGVSLQPVLLLDRRNLVFPIPSEKQIGDYKVRETRSLPYPFFPQLRDDSLADHPITAGLGQLILTWPSPLLPSAVQAGGGFLTLLRSSPHSWLSTAVHIQPDFQQYPDGGFPVAGEQRSYPLALLREGRFESFYRDRISPLRSEDGLTSPEQGAVIDHSPANARLLLVGSGSFLNDAVLALIQDATGSRYDKGLAFIANAIDWSLDDRGLLALRGRGQYSRLLQPLDHQQQVFWEWLNYGAVLLGLGLVWLSVLGIRRRQRKAYRRLLAGSR